MRSFLVVVSVLMVLPSAVIEGVVCELKELYSHFPFFLPILTFHANRSLAECLRTVDVMVSALAYRTLNQMESPCRMSSIQFLNCS